MEKLILFVDGYPEKDMDRIKGLGVFQSHFKMKPSFGYSVNLHHELFQGETPDMLGFFGDMSRCSSSQQIVSSNCLKLLDSFRLSLPLVSRVIYKLGARLFGWNIAFMPPSISMGFVNQGKYLLQKNASITISNSEFEVLCLDSKEKFGVRDEKVFAWAEKRICSGGKHILAAFTELDWVTHKYGYNSPEYEKKLFAVIGYVKYLSSSFLANYPGGEVILVSDHGMITCHTGVNYKLEKIFGMPFSDGVSYFYDSLYIHLWDDGNTELYTRMKRWLELQKEGSFISNEKRKKYKIDSHKYGNEIFCLHPGYGFAPNYFGYGLLKAYHGYDPDYDEGAGVFCTTRNVGSDIGYFSTLDVFRHLQSDLYGAN